MKPKNFIYSGVLFQPMDLVIYRVLLHRIGKRYSAEELSFLLGKNLSFIAHLEQLRFDTIELGLICEIAIALNLKDSSEIFSMSLPVKYIGDSLFQMCITHCEHRIIYQLNKLFPDESNEIQFFLQQECFDPNDYYSLDNDISKLLIVINQLLDGNYFDIRKSPLELFRRCTELSDFKVTPRLVYQTMNKIIKKQEFLKLKYCYCRQEKKYFYKSK